MPIDFDLLHVAICAANMARTLLRSSSLTDDPSALAATSSARALGRGGDDEATAAGFFTAAAGTVALFLSRLRLRLELEERRLCEEECEAFLFGLLERRLLLRLGLRSRSLRLL